MNYDAILVTSFGGPECPEDVMPYLENVLRGKNVPRERVPEVPNTTTTSAVRARSTTRIGNSTIVQVEDLGRLRLVVPVPEAYTAGIREGQQAAFSVPVYPGRTFHAPIARIAHDVTQNTRTMAVELDIRNTEGQITPGSFATVEWPVRRFYPTLFVPSTAVTTDLQRTFVIRVRQGKAEWVDVKTGIAVSGKTEVFGELQPGDMVVANATDAIRPGASLSTQQLPSPVPGI